MTDKDTAEPPSKKPVFDKKTTEASMSLKYLQSPFASLAYGRLDSDYQLDARIVNIDAQNTLSALVYDQINAVRSIDLAITQADFQIVWKSLILKRVQDIMERMTGQRAANFVRLNRSIPIPAPLGDLLHSLGAFHSDAHGLRLYATQPAQAAVVPAWWTPNAAQLADWIRDMGASSPLYQMSEFPSPTDIDNKPMLMLTQQIAGAGAAQTTTVKSFTNEVRKTDALVFAMQDDLFAAHGYITYANSHLFAAQNIDLIGHRTAYVQSYVLDSNA